MLRRDILKNGFLAAYLTATASLSLPVRADSTGKVATFSGNASIKFARALRLIGREQCIELARLLELSANKDEDISLHLRSAGISRSDVVIIADALLSLTRDEASSLRSFSLSFNPEIGDAGALAIARSLPLTLRELGLVGCRIADRGGEALLQWAQQASQLQMICIEDNRFSQPLRARFQALAQRNRSLMVVV